MGLKGDCGPQYTRRLRREHRDKDHPEADKSLFLMQGSSSSNASKASVEVRNRGAACTWFGGGGNWTPTSVAVVPERLPRWELASDRELKD